MTTYYRVTEPFNEAGESSQEGMMKVKAGQVITDSHPHFSRLSGRKGMLVEVEPTPPHRSLEDIAAQAKDEPKEAEKTEKKAK